MRWWEVVEKLRRKGWVGTKDVDEELNEGEDDGLEVIRTEAFSRGQGKRWRYFWIGEKAKSEEEEGEQGARGLEAAEEEFDEVDNVEEPEGEADSDDGERERVGMT